MKKALITGASGMVGSLVLDLCLASNEIDKVISLVRKPSGNEHPKLQEEVISDFSSYDDKLNFFVEIDAAFFCVGVYTGQVSDEEFKVITVDYAVVFANALKEISPSATLCLLSGAGADRSEKSRMAFAKYKGMAENAISKLGLGGFHTFRPGYIYPVTPRKEPNFMYRLSRILYPLIRLLGKNSSIRSTDLAMGMVNVGLNRAQQEILENKDILEYI